MFGLDIRVGLGLRLGKPNRLTEQNFLRINLV